MGAVGDGKTDNTVVFRKAFSQCSAVIIPSGVFLTLPLNITRNGFALQVQGTLLASTNASEWPVMPHLPSYPCDRDICSCCRYQPFVLLYNVSNVTVTGPSGSIDGQGSWWWERFKARPRQLLYGRPRLFESMYSYNLVLKDITLQNSPFWTTHIWASNTVLIDGVKVEAPLDSPNTDGFDPDSSENIVIRNSYVKNGDDCVAIKSGMNSAGIQFGRPSGNILIQNLRCEGTPISIGSEMSGGVFNVTVRDIPLAEALYIKTAVGRGGYVQDVVYTNVKLAGDQLLRIRTDYDHVQGQTALPIIQNIHYDHVEGAGVQAGSFSCTKDIPCTNITLSHVKLIAVQGFSCSNVTGSATDTHPKFCV
jgi:polygalacturonase